MGELEDYPIVSGSARSRGMPGPFLKGVLRVMTYPYEKWGEKRGESLVIYPASLEARLIFHALAWMCISLYYLAASLCLRVGQVDDRVANRNVLGLRLSQVVEKRCR